MDEISTLRLQWLNPQKNMRRFYTLQVTPDVFREWGLLRTNWFATQEEAAQAMQARERAKRERGYR